MDRKRACVDCHQRQHINMLPQGEGVTMATKTGNKVLYLEHCVYIETWHPVRREGVCLVRW